ncbi:MAG: PorT family protein [Saprospiraceae bacterium]|nr:PorT family protein [Candidatus Vicinibacter affinis]HQX44081.1 porin family protein [Saprospiraceae bacterium]
MKNYLILSFITIFTSGIVGAQHINFGFKVGLNLADIVSDDNSKTSLKPGLNVGAIGHIHLKNNFALQPEISYSDQGAIFKSSGVESKLNLGYINIPILLQYMFDNGFRIQAGPQLGILINAKAKSNDVSVDVKDDLNVIDFAISAGLSYVHPPSGFGVDARYNLGLVNLNKEGSVTSTNSVAQIGVFYLLAHK